MNLRKCPMLSASGGANIQTTRTPQSERYSMPPYYPMILFKPIITIERSFDDEGKPFEIADDDLEDIFSKSDFARGKRRP